MVMIRIKQIIQSLKLDFLLVILGIEIVMIGYVYDIKCLQQELISIQDKNILMKAKIKAKEIELDRTAKKRSPDMGGSIVDSVEVMEGLENKLHNMGLRPLCLEPIRSKKPLPDCMAWRIKLEVVGGYHKILSFLQDIVRSKTILVEEFCLQWDSNGSDDLYTKITVAVYQNNFLEPEGFSSEAEFSLELGERNIFSLKHSAGDLPWWDVKDFYFVGLLIEQKGVLGLIRDPHGGISQVKIGDKIGRDNIQVESIKQDSIYLSNNKKILRS